MDKIGLEIVALSHSVSQSHNYAIVLGEKEGSRRLPIVIGAFEAQAIAVALENMSPNRPLTHDLFKNTLDAFDIVLEQVFINQLVDGIFYAKLICNHNGNILEIDSRTSDAIAMAIRFESPIFTTSDIMDTAGVLLDDGDEDKSKMTKPRPKKKSVKTMSITDLNKKLDEALSREDYESAAKIRDEINSRKESEG
jgi:bifunctional DNase/RNase